MEYHQGLKLKSVGLLPLCVFVNYRVSPNLSHIQIKNSRSTSGQRMGRAHVHCVSFFFLFSAPNGLFSHPSPPFRGEEDEKVVFHPRPRKSLDSALTLIRQETVYRRV